MQKVHLLYEFKLGEHTIKCHKLINYICVDQNRSKLKQTEMECEYLKRWFGSLTEQNRRLKKEVEELRAMKIDLSTHSCQTQPTSTLTMCPHCERVTATNVRDESRI